MGLINELPINQKYASRLTQEHINDPYKLVDALKSNEFDETAPMKYNHIATTRGAGEMVRVHPLTVKSSMSKFPHRPIFGGDQPTTLSSITPLDERKF
jgi:hypothetical protein